MRPVILIAALACLATSVAWAATPTGIKPNYSRQMVFRIPFLVEPAINPDEQPREVQLHVSKNKGQFWQLAGTVKPEAGGFVFRAEHDGEYWFVVRTIDQRGTMRPQGPTVPEMIVRVDTEIPKLQLEAQPGAAGELEIRWFATDLNLASDRPVIEYKLSGQSGDWQQVAIGPALDGRATIRVSGDVLIRGRISDLAGNEAEIQVPASMHSSRGDLASNEPPGQNWNPPNNFDYPSTPYPTTDVELYDRRPELVRDPVQPPVTKHSGMPAGVTPELVNSLRFTLDYDIEAVGTSGIGKIELWGTLDGGRSWELYATDTDKRSPIEVNVPREGTYGFRMVVESGSGVGDTPPLPGDVPDVWVTVDTTRPDAQFVAIEGTDDANSPAMIIRWSAADQELDNRPVSIYFSTHRGGKWYPIATGLENTGSYRWTLGERIPDQIHLRLKVRDKAGNETTVNSADAIMADRIRPRTRIQSVKPVSARAGGNLLR